MKKTIGEMELERKTLPIGEVMFVRRSKGNDWMNYLGEVDCQYPSILRLSGSKKIDRGILLNPLGYENFKRIADRLEILLDRKISSTEGDYLCNLNNRMHINFEDEVNGGKGYFKISPNFPNKGKNFPKFPKYRNRTPKGNFNRFEEPGFLFNEIKDIWETFENKEYSEDNSRLINKIKYRLEDMKEIWTESFWYKGIMLDYQHSDEKKLFKFFEGMLDKNLLGLEEKRIIESLEKKGFQRQIILETCKDPIFKLSKNQIKKSLSRYKRPLEDTSPNIPFIY